MGIYGVDGQWQDELLVYLRGTDWTTTHWRRGSFSRIEYCSTRSVDYEPYPLCIDCNTSLFLWLHMMYDVYVHLHGETKCLAFDAYDCAFAFICLFDVYICKTLYWINYIGFHWNSNSNELLISQCRCSTASNSIKKRSQHQHQCKTMLISDLDRVARVFAIVCVSRVHTYWDLVTFRGYILLYANCAIWDCAAVRRLRMWIDCLILAGVVWPPCVVYFMWN